METELRSTGAVADGRLTVVCSCGTVVATCRRWAVRQSSPARADTMSCDDCAASVTKEVQQVDGVTAVVVDLEAGRVMVRGRGCSDEAVRAAVDKAGYEVVGA